MNDRANDSSAGAAPLADGKTWFITGATRGIGFHAAQAALQAGGRVVATGRNLAHLRSAFAGADPERVELAELDVVDAGRVAAAVDQALRRFGRIDVLVNNAGYGLLGNLEEIDADAIEPQFATNVFGLLHVLRAALPAMRRQRTGHVFNLSSVGGVLGFAGASVYCATKYAVEGLSASLADEVAQFGIKVTAVAPGFFRTDFLDEKSVRYGALAIDDYAAGANVKATYDAYSHRQAGDPARLGRVLVQLAAMDNPPRQFMAGSDALAMAEKELVARLVQVRSLAELSKSTDGDFDDR
jgi:NAD(P)-dependent dehydrogenase (short-subunit alcohol dehydrogenase family)